MKYLSTIAAACLVTASAAEPVFLCKSNAPGNIQFTAAPLRLELRFENHAAFNGEVTELVRVSDLHGNGDAPAGRVIQLEPGSVLTREIVIPPGRKGMFTITYSLLRGEELLFSRNVTGAVLDPVKALDPAGSPLGMYCHNVHWNGSRELPILQNMGISWVRANLLWRENEPERGKIEWDRGDANRKVLTAYGMNVMYNLVYPPKWAVKRVNSYGGNPANFAEYAAFAARAAARYPEVKHWSVWNEPDAESHWEGGGAEYARLLKAVAPAVRAANPQAKILIGGVTGSPALSARFLRELHAAKARPDFNIYEYHYRNLDLHRKLIREFGWEGIPLWNTEAAEGAEKASRLVRETISGFAGGVERTFVFLFTIKMTLPSHFEEFSSVVMVDNDCRPTENFPVVYTLSREINGIRECRDLSAGNIRLYSYHTGDNKIRYLLWGNSEKNRSLTLKSSAPMRIVDADGAENELHPFAGFISVPVSEVTYLSGGDVRPAGQAMAEIGAPAATPVFGTEFQIPVRFHNPAAQAFRGKAVLNASADWEVARAEIPLELAPDETREILCRLKPRRLTDCPKSRLTLKMFREDGTPAAYDFRDVKLATALDFTLGSAFRWGEPYVRAAITNPTAAPVKAEIRFSIPGKPERKATMPVTLPPLKTTYTYFSPALAAGASRGEAEATLTYPGGAVRKAAALNWIAIKPSGNAPIILKERSDYISPSRILFQWEGPDDLSLVAHLGWDAQYLKLTAEVTDDVHSPETDPALLWQRDSMQIWFGGMLFDLALTAEGAKLFRHDPRSAKMEIPFSVTRRGTITTYRISFPKPDDSSWQENDTVPFAFIVNDADTGAERKGWLYYLSDIGDPRCRPTTPEITLTK